MTDATALKVVDDNCCDRILDGSGLAYRDGNSVHHTDGSAQQGIIKLNPEDSNGLEKIFGRLADGSLAEIGQNATEGSVISRKSGKWTFIQLTEASRSFVADSIRSGSGRLAAFICSTGGSVELGFFDGCKNAFLFFDEDGNPNCKTSDELIAILQADLCTKLEDVKTDETVSHLIVCTQNGLRKKSVSPSNQILPNPVLIYQQYSLVNGAVTQPGITYFPALPSPAGAITSQSISFDLSTVPEYDPDVHTGAILRVNLLGSTITQSFDTVVEFGGIEVARTTIIGLGGDWAADANYSNPTVRIPSNGILTGNYLYQISAAGNAAGVIARVWLVGLI